MEPIKVDPTTELTTLVNELNNASKAFNPAPGPSGTQSRIEIIAKAKQIINAMRDPLTISFAHGASMLETMAIRTLVSLHVFEKIPGDGSITLEALSQATGVQDSLLERLLRILVVTGFVNQTPEFEYTHTKFSRAYATSPEIGKFFALKYDDVFLVLDRFHEYLADRKSLKEPEDPAFNPFTWAHKQDGTNVWEIMAQNPARLKEYQIGLATADKRMPTVGFYDFGRLNTSDSRPVFVDVGGGSGVSILAIMKAHPELAKTPEKFILQDLKGPIELAREAGKLPEGVKTMEHDFYSEQPVKGAKAYYIRRIMHDYSDANCVLILKRLAEAMSADSVVLISDMVIPPQCSETNLMAVMSDLAIMSMGGKERTEAGFSKILGLAGLELVKVWKANVEGDALAEARLATK
ncbi:MAG: hypothetical protein M1834_007615 [Cirrosporium novae-zelandiae]|nr:MAG: hypothetical protein M1834_007615 [Cirrosporium novae-zelandiae]